MISDRTQKTHLALAMALALAVVAAPDAHPSDSPQGKTPEKAVIAPDDADFSAFVRKATTKPEFLSPLVDHLPKKAGVPSPKDVLGYHIGTEKKLTYVADQQRYFRALDRRCPRDSRPKSWARPKKAATSWSSTSRRKPTSRTSRPTG